MKNNPFATSLPDPRLQQAFALFHAGKLQEAATQIQPLLALQPPHPAALHLMAMIALKTGQFKQAADLAHKAVSLNPNNAAFHRALGDALRNLKDLPNATKAYENALRLTPQDSALLSNYAGMLREQGRTEEAVHYLRESVKINPNYAQGWSNLGTTLLEFGKPEEAEEAIRKSLALDARNPSAHMNMGLVHLSRNKLDAAIDCYRASLKLAPNNGKTHTHLAMGLLCRGEYPAGFREHEWRIFSPTVDAIRHRPVASLIPGADLSGRHILVVAEQGFGDALHFARYVPMLTERGAKVTVECQPELQALFATLPGKPQTLISKAPLPRDVDAVVQMMSLPLFFGTTPDTIPAKVPYIQADPTFVEQWKKRLDGMCQPGQPFKVGLVWQGATRHKNDKNRSIPLPTYEPLADVPGVSLFSLQFGEGAKQIAQWPRHNPVNDLSQHLTTFAQTAAAISAMDLVITVDTSVAHLAGALGRPTWILIPFVPDWRWFIERDDSPWYPTVRLLRQPAPLTWPGVLQKAARDLKKMLAPK